MSCAATAGIASLQKAAGIGCCASNWLLLSLIALSSKVETGHFRRRFQPLVFPDGLIGCTTVVAQLALARRIRGDLAMEHAGPAADALQNRHDRFPLCGQRIFDTGRHLVVAATLDQVVGDELESTASEMLVISERSSL